MLQTEFNRTEQQTEGVLGNLISRLASQEISILHILNAETGVIHVDNKDRSWIERVCLASLIEPSEQKFIQADSVMKFDFEYVQSQMIRTYLLLCRINYRHIIQKYQCYQRPKATNTSVSTMDGLKLDQKYTRLFNDEQLKSDWNHLRTLSLDKLHSGYTLLRQIAITIQNQVNLNAATTNLFEFITLNDSDDNFRQQLERCEMKDFDLCHLEHVLKLYEQRLTGYEHIFRDIPTLLQIPLDAEMSDCLRESLDTNIIQLNRNNNIEKLEEIIQAITIFLNDLKDTENMLFQRAKESLVETCGHLAIENLIMKSLPTTIRCEHYMAVLNQLLQTRSVLEEQKLILKEKEKKLWQEAPTISRQKQRRLVYRYVDSNQSSESDDQEEYSYGIITTDDQQVMDLPENKTDCLENNNMDDHIEYSSLYELKIKLVPCRSSSFFEQMQKYREEPVLERDLANKAFKFLVIHPDSKRTCLLCRGDKFLDNLKKLYTEKKYDPNQYVLVGPHSVCLDLIKSNQLIPAPSPAEYSIVDKTQLIQVQFHFRSQIVDLYTKPNNRFDNILKHFIDTQALKTSKSDLWLCFHDQTDRCIEDGVIDEIHRTNDAIVPIYVTEETPDKINLCEITLTKDGSNQRVLFHKNVTWKQIPQGLGTFLSQVDVPSNDYGFYCQEEQTLFNLEQPVVSTIQPNTSTTVQVIDRRQSVQVILTYEKTSDSIHVAKSTTIESLFKNKQRRKKLNLIENSVEDYMITLEQRNTSRILSKEELREAIFRFQTEENDSIHLRLSLSKNIIIWHKQEQLSIPVTNMNITLAELVSTIPQLNKTTNYLASKHSKKILSFNEKLSTLNETNFLLVEEQEICQVRIVQLDETEISQQFCSTATIADLYHEYHLNDSNQHLLCSNDFVPSRITQLKVLQPVQLKIIEHNLPMAITIRHDDDQENSLQFNVNHQLTAQRVCSIACQLLEIDKNSCYLKLIDETEIDDDITLMDIDENITEMEFRLDIPTGLTCSILCDGQTIVLRCQNETILSTMVKTTLEKLEISPDRIDAYELYNSGDDSMQIDFDLTIADVESLFEESPKILSFELKLKTFPDEEN